MDYGRRKFSLACLVLLLNFAFAALPQAQTAKEYEIKAVLLMNLTRFVDWPDSAFSGPEAPIVIGVLGHDPFGRALDEAVRGERVNGRRIVVERFPSLNQIRPCQILFISRSQSAHLKQVLAKERNQPTLTVSEVNGFTTLDGGMVQLYVNNQNKVRLRVNRDAVQDHNLKLSSKLLEVAEITGGRPNP